MFDIRRETGIGFVAGLLSAFCLMHALLFVFRPSARTHLYFALISGLGAFMSWPLFALRDMSQHWFALLAVLVWRLFQLLFQPQLPPPPRSLVTTAVASASILLFLEMISLADGFFAFVIKLTSFVVIVTAAFHIAQLAWKAWKLRLDGSRSVVIGLVVLVFLSALHVEIGLLGGLTLSQFGVAFFFGATSVHLAREFAGNAQRLEIQAAELAESNRRLQAAHDQLEHHRQELTVAKESADAANAAKSRFLAGVSHELRTPLNAIIGYSEMIAEEAPDLGAPSLVPDLQKIQRAARHQLTLINDILDLSRIEAGRMPLRFEDIDLSHLLEDLRASVQPLINRNGNCLVLAAPPQPGTLHSDPTKVRQILINLLSNAAKFTENGTITLRLSLHSDAPAGHEASQPATTTPPQLEPQSPTALASVPTQTVIFEVEDTGIGIDAQQQTRLFQPFIQADTPTQARYGGTGLGLALSRRFADLLGGQVTCRSIPGQGSVFTVVLPLLPTPPPILATPGPETLAPPSENPTSPPAMPS
jgi:signal transduction histidine kinase